MKYFILTREDKLAQMLAQYEEKKRGTQKAWNKLAEKYESQIISVLGVPMGFFNPNDEAYTEFDKERGYDVPIEDTVTEYELQALPSMPIDFFSIVGVNDSFVDYDFTFVATKQALTESRLCREITEALYYEAKSACTGHTVQAAKECPHCGNKLIMANDKVCFKCGNALGHGDKD